MNQLVGTRWHEQQSGSWILVGIVSNAIYAIVQPLGGSYEVRAGAPGAVARWPVSALRPTLEDAKDAGDDLAYQLNMRAKT